ncbi:MAG TPA: hypothetical protein VNF45_02535 [Candidatus Binataceae bacterium]|nr:hypothetical protein [Candidatus Binataceae bacterium]
MPLDGIRGHREIITRLEAELASRPSHAYLLAGPRGVGKAAIARGLAMELLCERTPGPGFCCCPENCRTRIAAGARTARGAIPNPDCDCCAACVQAAYGLHPDLTVTERAANRSEVLIEQVRELIARMGTRPVRAPRRVAIIDDAETLNIPAQNALLKTLEEPPGDAIIFMVTRSERALLETIRSRMRLVRFGPLAAAEIRAILVARGIADEERAATIARLARGSASRAMELAEGADTPPAESLLRALAGAAKLDFPAVRAIASEFFADRAQAAGNFELLARLLEEILCLSLSADIADAQSDECARLALQMAKQFSTDAIIGMLDGAVKAGDAIEAMANSQLQAEQWWLAAAEALGGG